jgi:hypothetical protein
LSIGSTSFVFVTARRWPGKTGDEKERWAAEKRQEGIWKDVRAYDADDLETWLEQAPAVDIWFSTLIGKQPAGVKDVDRFWEVWSGATDPQLSLDLLIAGREEKVSEIHQWLRSEPSIIGLRADTINTSYVERLNRSIRNSLARFIRCGMNCSKNINIHTNAIDFFQAWYKFVKPHKSLRLEIKEGNKKWKQRTPAMAEGLTDHVWSLYDLLCFRISVS